MDLLECPGCAAGYVVCCAGDGSGWICAHCHAELRLRRRSVDAAPAEHLPPQVGGSLVEVSPRLAGRLLGRRRASG